MAVDAPILFNDAWCYLRDSMGYSHGAASDEQRHNADMFYNALRVFGYSHAAACGIIGNMQTESGLSPAALSGNLAVLPGYAEHFTDVTNQVLLQWNRENSTGAHAAGLVQFDGYTDEPPPGHPLASMAIRYDHAWIDWVVQLFRLIALYCYDPWGWGGINGRTIRTWYYKDQNGNLKNTITWKDYMNFSGSPADAADHWRINFERSSGNEQGNQFRRDNATWWSLHFIGELHTRIKYELPIIFNADAAYLFRDSEYTYAQYDCIDFINLVRHRLGLETIGDHDGHYGTNTLWRDTTGDLLWKGTLQECYNKFGSIPAGAYLFKCYPEGSVGYDTIPSYYRGDGIGNFSHIGIYTGLGKGVMQSGGYDITPEYGGINGVHDSTFEPQQPVLQHPWWTHVAIGKNFVQSGAPSPVSGNFQKWMVILLKRKKVLARERKFF